MKKLNWYLKKVKLYGIARWLTDDVVMPIVLGFKRRANRRQVISPKDITPGIPRILVVMNAGGIGNAVEATPLVEAVRSFWPGAQITLLVPRGDLFDNWCVPDHIVTSPDEIRGKTFDHSFFTYRGHKGMPKWDADCELGRIHLPKVWLDKWFVKPERLYDLAMIKRLGYKGHPAPLYVSLNPPAINIPPAELRICIAPGGKANDRWRFKRWPFYDQLLTRLREQFVGVQIVIIGTLEDDFPGRVPDEPNVIDLRGKLTLSESAWVLKNSNLAIGNDCGPMHIADAVGVRSVILFGPTCEVKNGPWNKAVTLSADVACRPCQYGNEITRCQDPQCMTKITPQQVMDSVERMLR
ncbi:MAG: glycosyltransferase family 9 protein [Phycisphaerae bacterium]|nr:glycosyltransferase family 9 protein [Phycisphaerae bacterium]